MGRSWIKIHYEPEFKKSDFAWNCWTGKGEVMRLTGGKSNPRCLRQLPAFYLSTVAVWEGPSDGWKSACPKDPRSGTGMSDRVMSWANDTELGVSLKLDLVSPRKVTLFKGVWCSKLELDTKERERDFSREDKTMQRQGLVLGTELR